MTVGDGVEEGVKVGAGVVTEDKGMAMPSVFEPIKQITASENNTSLSLFIYSFPG